jgi:PTS system beta-glucosides-specific IIC component
MDNEKLARDILEHIGGEENIDTVTHCATRLRMNLKNNEKADQEAIKALDGVVSVVTQNDQFQIVIGNNVNKVYKSMMEQTNLNEKTNNTESETDDNKSPVAKAFDILSGIFVPIVPVLAGSGMLKALLTILNFFELINPDGQTFQLLTMISDAGFYFLPIILAHSASVKFKTNPYISMALGGVLLHPSFQAMVQAGGDLRLFGLPVGLVNYSSSVIPIILLIWALSYIEPIADRIVPSVLRIFGLPFIIFLVAAPLALIVIGPLGSYLGDGLAFLLGWIDGYASWLIPTIVGAFTPFLVMVGMHYALISVGINSLATSGFETIAGPGMLVSNIAQGGAVLALSLKTKDKQLKSLSISTGISAVLGITEPALYGVELQNRRTLISAMIGGGTGGLFLGVMNVVRYVQVPPSIIGLTGFIGGEGLSNFYLAAAGSGIAFVVGFVAQLILGVDEDDNNTLEEVTESFDEEVEETQIEQESATIIEETKELGEAMTITAPLNGQVIPLSEVSDAVFASEALGKGGAIKPSEGKVYAPFDGEITVQFPTNHAIGLTSNEGVEVLIHCGLDTVSLDGKGFTAHVEQGQTVTAGDLLLTMDIEYIQENRLETVTPIVVTNADQFKQIDLVADNEVQSGEDFIVVQ